MSTVKALAVALPEMAVAAAVDTETAATGLKAGDFAGRVAIGAPTREAEVADPEAKAVSDEINVQMPRAETVLAKISRIVIDLRTEN